MKVKVNRKEHFTAAHKLYNHEWTKEKNELVFGPCANENWHGHNFELIVTVTGEVDKETGYVVDLKALSDLVRKKVISQLDHRNINLEVEFMKGKMASCENLIVELWQILEPQISRLAPHARLHRLALHETKNNFVEYSGEDQA